MPLSPKLRTIPDRYEPLVAQWLLNLAIHHELADEEAALQAVIQADTINQAYDTWLVEVDGNRSG